MRSEEMITLRELKERIGRFPDDTKVFFGCPDEANPLELVGVEENGGESIQIRFRLNVYRGRKCGSLSNVHSFLLTP